MANDDSPAQIESRETQLIVLKARVRNASGRFPQAPVADLEGILAGVAESAEEELRAAEYRVIWDDKGSNEWRM